MLKQMIIKLNKKIINYTLIQSVSSIIFIQIFYNFETINSFYFFEEFTLI